MAWAQLEQGAQSSGFLGATGGVGNLSQGGMGAMSEAELLRRYHERERSRNRSGDLRNLVADTANLLAPDSALDAPIPMLDTVFYHLVRDTISRDSLMVAPGIMQNFGMLTDGRFEVLRYVRKKAEPKKLQRYESQIFGVMPPSMFATTSSAVGEDYPLKFGDALILTVWGEVEREMSLRINSQGTIFIEGVGVVSVNGLTLGQAEKMLSQRLGRIYSGIARGRTFVNLRIESLSAIKVFFLGEVQKPGGYALHGNTSILQGLYHAGGPSARGSVRNIRINRGDSVLVVDMYQYLMQGKRPQPSVLRDGDVVFLPRAEILVAIEGDIGRPAIYELQSGEGVRELLQFASGLNATSAKQSLVVRRIESGGSVEFLTIGSAQEFLEKKSVFNLRDGDFIAVPSSTQIPRSFVSVVGSVMYPGTYQYQEGMTVADLLKVAGGLRKETFLGRVQVLRPINTGGHKLFSQSIISEENKSILLQPRDTLFVYDQKSMFQPDSVAIGGAVVKPGIYPFFTGMKAKDLVLMAGGFLPNRQKGRMRIDRLSPEIRAVGVEERKVQDNYDVDEEDVELRPWDHVEIPEDPNFYRPQKIRLEGAFKQPGTFSMLKPGESLQSLINRSGGFQNDAYLDGAQFYRLGGERALFVGQIGVDIAKAMEGDERNNIQLQDGDSLYVPTMMISVKVSGEVGYTTNVLWRKGRSTSWYIAQAGGFKHTADQDRVMIRYANGSSVLASEAEREPDPGSEIIVPFREPPPPVNWVQVAQASAGIFSALATILLAVVTIYTLDRR